MRRSVMRRMSGRWSQSPPWINQQGADLVLARPHHAFGINHQPTPFRGQDVEVMQVAVYDGRFIRLGK